MPETQLDSVALPTDSVAESAADPTTQSVDDLVSSLVVEDGWPHPAILREIVAHGQASVAPLIALIERTPPSDIAAYQAIELLTILGDPSVLPSVAAVYRGSDDDTMEPFQMSLPAFGAAALPYFLPIIGERSLTWYQRTVASEIAMEIAGNDTDLRQQVAEVLGSVLASYVAEADRFPALSQEQGDEYQDFVDNVGSLVGDLALLGVEESRPVIQAAFDAGIVEGMLVDEEFVKANFGHPREPFVSNDWITWYEDAYEHRNDPPPAFPKFTPEVPRGGQANITPSRQPYIAPPKPGRNDPCWCGSGKKYKKCHLGRPDDRFALNV